MTNFSNYRHPYQINEKFSRPAAYFSMEFAIDQSLKTYSGGLGFLAGSHMRSAYDLKQNLVGIGILWKFGYYDQVRKADQGMEVLFQEKLYSFLEDTGIRFEVTVHNHPVRVKAMYLHPEVFGTVPMFFLSTELPENDFLAQSITHRLYDAEETAKIAASIVLGNGGGKLLDILNFNTEVYHLNEAHGLPISFYLHEKHGSLEEVQKRLVFTTHTPEEAGNKKTDINLLKKMSYFNGIELEKVREITGIDGHIFDHSLAALRMSRKANGVSAIHGQVAREMWGSHNNIAPIGSITNSQSKNYWADSSLYKALNKGDDEKLVSRKKKLKKQLFERVADQTGVLLDPEALTVVWARRFAAYKRADLLHQDMDRFRAMMANQQQPVQVFGQVNLTPTIMGR